MTSWPFDEWVLLIASSNEMDHPLHLNFFIHIDFIVVKDSWLSNSPRGTSIFGTYSIYVCMTIFSVGSQRTGSSCSLIVAMEELTKGDPTIVSCAVGTITNIEKKGSRVISRGTMLPLTISSSSKKTACLVLQP
jgi:hypothetical protein